MRWLLVICVTLAACNAGGLDPKEDPNEEAPLGAHDFAWDGLEMRAHRDNSAQLRFLVPATGYRVTATHFDPSTPPVKLKHSIVLAEERREILRIEVWNNVERLALRDWFDRYLAFTRPSDAIIEPARAGRGETEAIVVLFPRSPQALARRAAVFALGERIVRVTSIDDADPRAHALYRRVLHSLEADVSP